MAPSTIVVPFSSRPAVERLGRSAIAWAAAGVREVIVVGPGADGMAPPASELRWMFRASERPFQGRAWEALLDRVSASVLLMVNGDAGVEIDADGVGRLSTLVEEAGASVVYSNFVTEDSRGRLEHPTIPYQVGSIRDHFDFGPVVAVAMQAVREARGRFGALMETEWSGWYDLRLRLSELSLPVHVPEGLYRCLTMDARPTGQQQFDYQDPRHRAAQVEMERVATEHLKRIGAFLAPTFAAQPSGESRTGLEASVVIPVRNRVKTIGDAVRSALSQQAPFRFNVIVMDNHSTDGTTDVLRELAGEDERLIHLVPERTDLGIGGCWNLAVRSRHCGRIAAQLDSDDLYAGPDTLLRIVAAFDEGPYAMVVGSYRMVNFDLEEIPPGLIDHREWSRDNGRNNLLRVNGLGAPRAFLTEILRRHPLPNVSYGEDYATGLRLSREYEIGRIYDPIYLCRRWEGNSDADLPIATKNQYDTYKDRLRTLEILARQQINLRGGPGGT